MFRVFVAQAAVTIPSVQGALDEMLRKQETLVNVLE